MLYSWYMEPLAKLFASQLRVKIMRLFLFQEGEGYTINEIVVRTQSKLEMVKKELKLLESAGFISCKEFDANYEEVLSEDIAAKHAKTRTRATSKFLGYAINSESPLIRGLKELLIDSNLITTKDLQKHFAGFSYIKLLLLSGVFLKLENTKADLLLVGEKIDMKRLTQTIKLIESEIGKEIRYSVFTPEEFLYRISMYDKYVLDILTAPHERVIEKMQIPKP